MLGKSSLTTSGARVLLIGVVTDITAPCIAGPTSTLSLSVSSTRTIMRLFQVVLMFV